MPMFRDIPIKQKLMLVLMVTTGTALLLAGAGILALDSFLFRGYLERDISALAGIIADNSTAALSFDDTEAATGTLAALRARPHIAAACIYRPDGTVFARYRRPDAPPDCPPQGAPNKTRFTSEYLTTSRPLLLQNRPMGTLLLMYD